MGLSCTCCAAAFVEHGSNSHPLSLKNERPLTGPLCFWRSNESAAEDSLLPAVPVAKSGPFSIPTANLDVQVPAGDSGYLTNRLGPVFFIEEG